MSEMVERVARAINSEMVANNFVSLDEWLAFKLARAAIEAMREPTQKMVEVGEKHMDSCWTWNPDGGSRYNDPEGTFSAMIDEALK